MHVSPFEAEEAAPAADPSTGSGSPRAQSGGDGSGVRRADAEVRKEMRASPEGEEDGQRRDEAIDEPGYGHGV